MVVPLLASGALAVVVTVPRSLLHQCTALTLAQDAAGLGHRSPAGPGLHAGAGAEGQTALCLQERPGEQPTQMLACRVSPLARDLPITGAGHSCETKHGSYWIDSLYWIKLRLAALLPVATQSCMMTQRPSALMSPHLVMQYEQDAKGLWELAVATAKPCTDVGLLIEASNLIQNPSMAPTQQSTDNGALPGAHNSQPPKVSCMEPLHSWLPMQ